MRLTDDVRTLMRPNDPAPPASEELSEQARFTLEDILVSRPGAVSTRTGVGPTPRRTLSGRNRRKRRWLIPMSVVVATSTGVAVALVYPQPERAKVFDRVDCYSDTDLTADPFHGGSAAGGDLVPLDNPAVAKEYCANMWGLGLLRPGLPTVVFDPDDPNLAADQQKIIHPVPHLVACVRDGAAAVFPSDNPDFCRTAGLPELLTGR
ncbi:hypothetical protein OG216_24790 [Streptomycetaceae bacterium NBC_01309]